MSNTVLELTEKLTDSLEQNYKNYTVRSFTRNVERNDELMSDYSKERLAEIENGTAKLMKFRIQEGKKYYKIIQCEWDDYKGRNEYRDGGVHAFVDKFSADVYIPASWKSPAKHVRFNLRNEVHQANLFNPLYTDWAGGYLYMR